VRRQSGQDGRNFSSRQICPALSYSEEGIYRIGLFVRKATSRTCRFDISVSTNQVRTLATALGDRLSSLSYSEKESVEIGLLVRKTSSRPAAYNQCVDYQVRRSQLLLGTGFVQPSYSEKNLSNRFACLQNFIRTRCLHRCVPIK